MPRPKGDPKLVKRNVVTSSLTDSEMDIVNRIGAVYGLTKIGEKLRKVVELAGERIEQESTPLRTFSP